MIKSNLDEKMLKQIDDLLVYSSNTKAFDNGKNSRYISYSANNLKRIIITPVGVIVEYHSKFNGTPKSDISYTTLGCNLFYECFRSYASVNNNSQPINPNKLKSLTGYIFSTRAYNMLEEIVFINSVGVTQSGKLYSFNEFSEKDKYIFSNVDNLFECLLKKMTKSGNNLVSNIKENYPRLRSVTLIQQINLKNDNDLITIVELCRTARRNSSTIYNLNKSSSKNLLPYDNEEDYLINPFKLTPLHYEIDIMPEKGSNARSLYTYFDELKQKALEDKRQNERNEFVKNSISELIPEIEKEYNKYVSLYHARYKLAQALNKSSRGTELIDKSIIENLYSVMKATVYLDYNDIKINQNILDSQEVKDSKISSYKESLKNLLNANNKMIYETKEAFNKIKAILSSLYPFYIKVIESDVDLSSNDIKNIQNICFIIVKYFVALNDNSYYEKDKYIKGGN